MSALCSAAGQARAAGFACGGTVLMRWHPRRLYTRGGIMPDHPAGARRVFLRVAGEVGVAVHEHMGVQKVRGDALLMLHQEPE